MLVHPSRDAVTLYVPLSLTALRVFDVPLPLPLPLHANVAFAWSLDAVSVTVSPSHTFAGSGSDVSAVVGRGLIVIVFVPVTLSFLQLPSSLTDFTVYVYSPTAVGTSASIVYAVERLFFVLVVPVLSV